MRLLIAHWLGSCALEFSRWMREYDGWIDYFRDRTCLLFLNVLFVNVLAEKNCMVQESIINCSVNKIICSCFLVWEVIKDLFLPWFLSN